MKSNEGCLRFFFMTGITKYRQTSIFSEFNFFDDISLNRAYGTLIGYTEEEIKNYFSYYLNEAKLQLELDEDEIVDQLRKNYDGFSFDQEAATHVFCPWSVLNFFKYPQQGFKNYWYVNFQKSGNSTP
ncbi:MAG: AAA family ATPase [Sutterella wadsworthensis]|nr:AAA family ATPase [Sutterella wadsworthensis]